MEITLLQIKEATDDKILSPHDIVAFMASEKHVDREAFWVLHLNTALYIIEKELVALGTLNASYVHPREVFKKAILNSSSAIITIHNHPSGETKPSNEDKQVWDKLNKAGELLCIPVIDNLIIGVKGKGYYSDSEEGESGWKYGNRGLP